MADEAKQEVGLTHGSDRISSSAVAAADDLRGGDKGLCVWMRTTAGGCWGKMSGQMKMVALQWIKENGGFIEWR